MVDQAKIDIMVATIAILTTPPEQPGIDQKELEQVLTPPLTIGQAPQGLLVGSQRDQTEVIVGGNKTDVRDLSGRKTFSRSKIPTILHFFVDRAKMQVISYGVNFVTKVPCAEPAKWIADNLLSTNNVSEKTGGTLIGSAAALRLASGQKIWNIKFEPSGDKAISVASNASEEIQQLPSQERLREELKEQFQALLKFLNDLGL